MADAGIHFSIRDLVPQPDLPLESPEYRMRAHRIVQSRFARRYKSFESEVNLRHELVFGSDIVVLTGRLDGLITMRRAMTVLEIKPVPGSAKRWLNHSALEHARWQVILYAGLCSLTMATVNQRRLPIKIRLVLVGTDDSVAIEEINCSSPEAKLTSRLEAVLESATQTRAFESVPAVSLHQFVRADKVHDRAVQAAAWEQLERGSDRLLLALPPGSGKTRLAVRWGLLRASSERCPLVWVTMKNRGRLEVLNELDRYYKNGIPLRIVWKTSADRRCSCAHNLLSCECHRITEEQLFWNGVPNGNALWLPDSLDEYASASGLCPYSISCSVEKFADVVIADLNYLLFGGLARERRVIYVVDEYHNLSERLEANFTIHLTDDELLETSRGIEPSIRATIRSLLNGDDGDWTSAREAFTRVAASLSKRVSIGRVAIDKINRLVRHLSNFASDYRLLRGFDNGRGFWIGKLADSKLALDRFLDEKSPLLSICGSLPEPFESRTALIPDFSSFNLVEPELKSPSSEVLILPSLRFRFPLSLEDHQEAAELCCGLIRKHGATLLVFGQNRESNLLLSDRLRAKGLVCLIDEDVKGQWELVSQVKPDAFIGSLGSNTGESVNPPPEIFSACAILSPGFRSREAWEVALQDYHELDVTESRMSAMYGERARAVSRIIQAVGRVQRSPECNTPVYLLNEVFADESFLMLWPRHWYSSNPRELVIENIDAD